MPSRCDDGYKAITHFTRHVEQSAPEIIEAWEGIAFLVRRPNRRREPKLYIRAVLGELAPWRLSDPFEDLDDARRAFARIVDTLKDRLEDVMLEAMNVAGALVSRED